LNARCDGEASETVIARYFDPKLGRFLTQDSFLGNIDNPPSLHRYFYGYANPTRYIDPTGHAAGDFWDPRSYDWQAFKADLVQNADKRVYGIGAAVVNGTKSLARETVTSAYDVGALTLETGLRVAGRDVNFELYSDTAKSTGERMAAGESTTSIIAGNVGNAAANAASAGLWGTGKEYYETYRDYQSGKIDNAGVEQRLIDAAGGAVTNAALASVAAKTLEGKWTGSQTVVEHFTQMPSQARGLAEATGQKLGNLAERGFEKLHDTLGRNDFTSLGRIEPPVAAGSGVGRFTGQAEWTAPAEGTGHTYKTFRQDVDWNLKFDGITNLERAQSGKAPYVMKDGVPQRLNLHHSRQSARGPLFEVSESTHLRMKSGRGREALHPYGQSQHPYFPVDRPAFGIDKTQYWMDRAAEAIK
jgi:hypothetical protein